MDTSQDKTLSAYEAMQIAIELERDGFQFYKDVAARAVNGRVRAVFQKLAREEMTHLVKIEQDILPRFKSGEYDFDDTREAVQYLLATQRAEVIDDAVKPMLAEQFPATDVEALDLGIKAEEESVVFYNYLAETVNNEDAQKAFRVLVEEERAHRDLLRTERDYYRRLGATQHSQSAETTEGGD